MGQKIYMKSWLDLHGRAKVVGTDRWYLDLANKLLPVVSESLLYNEEEEDAHQNVALILVAYLEDCVADGGHWRRFIHWHQKNYGRYLPFYTLTEDYLPDEINKEDVALLLWGINSPAGDEYDWVGNPMDEDLLEFANVVFDLFDEAFEEAPVSEHLAGDWFMENELMDKERTPVPVASLNEKQPTNVELFLKASGGESLLYFDSYDALRLFFITTLGWDDDEDSLLPDLRECLNFVLLANPKGLLIGPDVASYFAEERNPLYDAEASEEEAYELFCEQGLCPSDLLKYAVDHNLLPDAQFPFEDGKRLLQENWDFVARWFLGEYYEGE